MPWSTIGAAAIGAVLAGIVNMYAANRGIREVKLQYEYKLRDGYLDNARKFIGEVYVPISIALTALFKNYEQYATALDQRDAEEFAQSKQKFQAECKTYVAAIDELLARGADAYLTTALDERLNEFTNFVRNSMHEIVIRKRRVLETHFDMFGLTTSPKVVAETASSSWIERIAIPRISLSLPFIKFFGIGMTFSEKILAAPTETREFEARIRKEIPEIKFLIKEVTLGSNPASR